MDPEKERGDKGMVCGEGESGTVCAAASGIN